MWNLHRSFDHKSNLLSRPKTRNLRAVKTEAISRLCAHYYLELDNVLEIVSLNSFENSFSEKLQHFKSIVSKTSEHVMATDRNKITRLAVLISELFYYKNSSTDNLLAAAKILKVSVRQIFHLCSPELFFQLLITGGHLLRTGSDLINVNFGLFIFFHLHFSLMNVFYYFLIIFLKHVLNFMYP